MKILFRRAQARTLILKRVCFGLWCELELTEEEKGVIKHYGFDQAILYFQPWTHLIRPALAWGAFTAFISFFLFGFFLGRAIGGTLAIVVFAFTVWFYIDRWREIIWVKDVIHGRDFRCYDVTGLVLKERKLEELCGYFRDMMENAKNWDGNQIYEVPPFDAEMARKRIMGEYY